MVRRLVRARDLVHDAFDEPLTLDELARAAGISRFHFLRAFTDVFGATPHAYLTQVRLEEAKRALARGASATEACYSVGFSSLGSFSTLFSRNVGSSPREWQRRARAVITTPGRWQLLWIPSCFLSYASRNSEEAPLASGW